MKTATIYPSRHRNSRNTNKTLSYMHRNKMHFEKSYAREEIKKN